MAELPTLDAHAHIDARVEIGLEGCGAVLAQTMSLREAERSIERREASVAWGVGCHPRLAGAQADFNPDRYAALLERTAIAGEVGLDPGSAVPASSQLATFRSILRVVAERPRIISIHSFRAVRPVLDELGRTPVIGPVLHSWTGRAEETSEAVRLGCYFSVHSSVARRTVWRTRVPLERILIESDHGWRDPPDAIPLRIGWVEHLLAQQYGISPVAVRETAWRNLSRLVEATGTLSLLPPGIAGVLSSVKGAG